MSESYASDEALAIAREGDDKFTLAYIVGALSDPTPEAIASAIAMAEAYAPNLYGKQWLTRPRKTREQKDSEIAAIVELLKPVAQK
jgi:hypothetical protein